MSQKGMEKKKKKYEDSRVLWLLTETPQGKEPFFDAWLWKNKEQAVEGVVAHFFSINMGLMKDT